MIVKNLADVCLLSSCSSTLTAQYPWSFCVGGSTLSFGSSGLAFLTAMFSYAQLLR